MKKDFLQSNGWRRFQEAVGRRTFFVSSQKSPSNPPFQKGEDLFLASIIEHKLPIVGKYFYIPRGFNMQELGETLPEIINLAKENNIGWLRIDPVSEGMQEPAPALKIKKAPHDMQPKELFIIDIVKEAEEILSQMKSKTRYNIRLAEKKGVKIFTSRDQEYIDKFCELVEVTAKRDRITPHPKDYYKKMLEIIPGDNLKLYLAQYEGKIIAANLVSFYEKTATYLHGASDNEHRNAMAPYLLQWQAMLDAKEQNCTKYDFGGVKTEEGDKSWAGITKFKTGFSPSTSPTVFPGSYDIILNPVKYNLYRFLQKIRSFI